MAPNPEEHKASFEVHKSVEEEQTPTMDQIVISGMAGLFPNSKSVKDLSNILYEKKNPVTSENSRWLYNHPEVPEQLGKIPGELEKFDAQFFKVHYRLGKNMDAMARKVLEQTYHAIYDAGVNPENLSGKKVGVFVGSCFSESDKAFFYIASSRTGFGIAGCSRAMFANRISYWLNLKGPSVAIDAACSSSAVALERAYLAIKSGECEAAIVGGAYICLHPQSSVHLARCVKLCMDGKTKSFDNNADGCSRSEAISVLFLQKAKDAKRIYADVCYVKSNFCLMTNEIGSPKYGPYRDQDKLTEFLRVFYNEAGVHPSQVDYIEAWGSAIPEADKNELEIISNVFCKDRKTPISVGNIISNIGYTEAASGNCSIIKVLLGFHTGKLAANLHCDNPRDDVEALRDGRMRIVTEHQQFSSKYVGVSNTSITGINVHILLKRHVKPKDPSRYISEIPHLVTISARQESGIKKILTDLKSRPIDPEEFGLLHNMYETRFPGHLGRGFGILAMNSETNETECLHEQAKYFDYITSPIWFVYSGMGSQWAGMGAQLMRIPIFAASIERCNKVLKPKGLDIIDIITSKDKKIFDNILNSFVGIAAIQIGLTDILSELGLVPDKIIGHSVGELGCAYADGCMTAEEMILSAYSRGLVSVQTPFIHGSMAAIGLGYNQIINMCPPEIEVACHNSGESSTISGPSEVMREFVAKLTAQGIFAKEVPCSNIAYHSRYIREAGPGLLKYLKEVLPTPKERSERWLSTSIPQDKWNEPGAKFSSAEYHTNNLLNSVLFEETARLIPSNAVLIEIAPHGLLQAILKRSMPASCVHVPLTRRGHPDSVLFLLEAIGQLYMVGCNPKIRVLYPEIEYPVSVGTPFLSHLVEWAHDETWPLPLVIEAHRRTSASAKYVISLYDDENAYLKGHVIGNKTLYPFSDALVCVWDTLAMSLGMTRRDISVQFQDVYLHEEPLLLHDKLLRLHVQLHKGNGYFEVVNLDTKIISGHIIQEEKSSETFEETVPDEMDEMILQTDDVYKMFYNRDIFYSGEFRSLKSLNQEMTRGKISWNGNWTILLDSMLQINALRRDANGLSRPRFIRKLHIDLKEHNKLTDVTIGENEIMFDANVLHQGTIIRCGGVAMEDLRFNDYPIMCPMPVTLKALKFIPFFQLNTVKITDALTVFLQIVAENLNKTFLNIIQLQNGKESTLRKEIQEIQNNLNDFELNFGFADAENLGNQNIQMLKKADLVLVKNIGTGDNICRYLYSAVPEDIFLVSFELSGRMSMPQTLCRIVASAATTTGRMVLARWRPAPVSNASVAVSVHDPSDLELIRTTRQTLRPDHRLVILSCYPPPHGLKDLVQKWRREPNRNKIYVAMINHKIANDQNLEHLPIFDLAFNILDHGTWGGEFYVKTEEHVIQSDQNVTMRCREIGDLETLHWVEEPELEPSKISVKVHFAGLNVCDAKRASGSSSHGVDGYIEMRYGMDFSGVTSSGERVMGLVQCGAASSYVSADSSMLWPVPADWTLEDAATVPLPFAHAIYLLGIKCHLMHGSSLLVTGATGGLGLAIISIALAYDCQVFATVSDMKKKYFLRKVFPNLPESHIGNSRNESFTDMVLLKTKGKGCDFVICCLEGASKNNALKCCGPTGVVLDTNQIACNENYQYGMNYLMKARNYIRVDFSTIFRMQNETEKMELQLMVTEGIKRGYVRPLPRVTYEASNAAQALRLLAANRQRGRVLLRLNETALQATSRMKISPYGIHLLLANAKDDTMIVKIVDVLINRGATSIFLYRRQSFMKVSNGFINGQIKKWQKLQVKVRLVDVNEVSLESIDKVIKECISLGPVEGVYLIANRIADDDNNRTKIINNLDVMTRKLCPSIRAFAIFNEESNIGQDICLSRAVDKLPSTMLNLPKMNKFEDGTQSYTSTECNGLSSMEAVEAMERALCASTPVLIAQISSSNSQNRIVDVTNLNSIEQTTNNARIRNLEEIKTEDKVTGLKVIFSHIDPDEMLASHDLIFMPTLTHRAEMNDDEFDFNETYLVMVPGLEGDHNKFYTLSERLKLPAAVLQFSSYCSYETVEEMAARLTKVFLKNLKPKQKFYLLGHSFGVLVALEMAAILEEQGLEGVVYCVDASPDTFPSALDSWLNEAGATDEVRLQDTLIQHMYTLMAGYASEHLQDELNMAHTWRQKVEVGVRALRGRVTHSTQYARALIEAAHARIEQARRYDAQRLRTHPLRSLIVVLRSSSQPDSVEQDLGLSRYSLRAPIVYNLNADHARALEDLRCSKIVNRHLHQDILDEFQKRNLCDTYLLNASRFMAMSFEGLGEYKKPKK